MIKSKITNITACRSQMLSENLAEATSSDEKLSGMIMKSWEKPVFGGLQINT